MLVFTSDPCCQVESVFETLVEDSPEEESTLTSKMSVCTCVRGERDSGGREEERQRQLTD